MSGYRGIFLDSIHPNIVNRLNADTEGMGRSDANPLNQNPSTVTYKYLQERTAWVRAVPFTIPQNIYGINNDIKEVDQSQEKIEPGNTPNTELAAPSSSMNLIVETAPRVPHWRNWVLYGTKARGIHGNKQDSHISPDQPYSLTNYTDPETGDVIKDSTAVFGRSLYPNSTTGWDMKQRAGVQASPPPGIVNLSVSNKGDLGTIRRATLDIKAHNLNDLEALEMMYMVPGMSILVEWGWYHPKLHVDPIDIETIKSGDELASTRAINEKILYKTFDIKDGQLHNISDPTAFKASNPELGTKAGLYDGFLGTVTKFNWTNDGQGGYDIRIDIIAPGSLTTGISVQTYKMATKIYDQEEDIEIAYTDIEAAGAILQQSTLQVETLLQKELVAQNLRGEGLPAQIRTTDSGDGYDLGGDQAVKIPIKTQALDRKNKGVRITKGENGLEFEVEILDPENPPEETVDYFLEEYKGGNEYEVQRIYGDPNWWRRVIAYLTADSIKVTDVDKHMSVSVNKLQENDRPDVIHDYKGDDDEEYNVAKMNQVFGRSWVSGNYFVNKWADGKSRPGFEPSGTGWRLWTWVDGKYSEKCDLGQYVSGGKGQILINGKNSNGNWMFKPGCNIPVAAGHSVYGSKHRRTPRMVDPGTDPPWNNSGTGIKDKHCVNFWQDLAGAQQMKYKANTLGWTKDADGGYIDKNGQPVNVQGGNNAGDDGSGFDPVIATKKTGVSVIQRTIAGDGTVTYTAIDHLQGEDASAITKDFNKAILDKENQVKEENELAEKERLETQQSIVAAIENKSGVTWSGVSFGKQIYKYGAQVNLLNPSLRRPTVGPDGTRTGYEVGYDFLGNVSTDPNAKSYPVGGVALTDTYISWRFIEDYLINELFMPRLEITGNDSGAIQPLESTFGSWDIMSDREKAALIQNLAESGTDRDGKIKEEIERQIKALSDANEETDNEARQSMLDDESEMALDIIKPVQIINHRNIRSTNSKVCLLPGQERPASEQNPETGEGFVPNANAKYLIDYAADGGAGEDPKFYDPNFCGKDAMNIFAGFNADGSRDPNSGILRNILVNMDFVNNVAKDSDNVRDFVMGILDGVNEACGMPWSFKIITISATNQLKVIDENYTPEMQKFREEATKNYLDTESGVYKFTGAGSKNILKDVKIQSKLPSELATAAYFATMNQDPDGNNNIQTFAMYGVGLTDRLKQLSRTVIVGDNGEQAKAARAEMVSSYLEGVINSRVDHIMLKTPAKQIAEAQKMNALYVNNYVKGNSFEVKNYAPPIPIDISMDLHGISGIFMGNAVMLATIAEGGVLPSRYKDVVALQCTSVNHSISSEGWTTSIDTLMRPLPMSNRTAQIIKTTMKEQTPDPEIVNKDAVGSLHPHWKRFLSGGGGAQAVPWSAGCVTYMVKKSGVNWPKKGAHTKYAQAIREGGYPEWEDLDPLTTQIQPGDVIVKVRSGRANKFGNSSFYGSSHGDIVTETSPMPVGNPFNTKCYIIGGNVSNTMCKVEVPLKNGKIPADICNTGVNGSYFVVLRAKSLADRAKVVAAAKGTFASYPGPEKQKTYTLAGKYKKREKMMKADEGTKEAAMWVYDMYKAGNCWSGDFQCSAPHPVDGLSASSLSKSITRAKKEGVYNIDTGQLA